MEVEVDIEVEDEGEPLIGLTDPEEPNVLPFPEKADVLGSVDVEAEEVPKREDGVGRVAARSAASHGGSPVTFESTVGTTTKIEYPAWTFQILAREELETKKANLGFRIH